VRGIALGLHPADDPADVDAAVDEIAATGANAIAIAVHWSQRDVRSVTIRPGSVAVQDELVRRVVRRAKRQGLRTLLLPILIVERTTRGQWRGTIAPADPARWWRAYERFILHYAAIAADEAADWLAVGSELGPTEAWRDRWYHLISRVEKLYAGGLVYSANWDHYESVSFWARLDAIGVTGYQPLARDRDAPQHELTRSWRAVRDALVAHAQGLGLPLWITEVGYTSVDGTATAPWDYLREGRVDHDEQARCYTAFAEAWDGQALDAVFFWNWHGEGGATDRGYSPKRKPAEAVLRRWFDPRAARVKRQ
jgi:hypothetical protein